MRHSVVKSRHLREPARKCSREIGESAFEWVAIFGFTGESQIGGDSVAGRQMRCKRVGLKMLQRYGPQSFRCAVILAAHLARSSNSCSHLRKEALCDNRHAGRSKTARIENLL